VNATDTNCFNCNDSRQDILFFNVESIILSGSIGIHFARWRQVWCPYCCYDEYYRFP